MAPNDPSRPAAPPPTASTPPDYTPFFCEENVYRLAARPDLFTGPTEVVFITNPRAAVACWFQRAAPEPGQALVWDYHVVLVEHPAPVTRARSGHAPSDAAPSGHAPPDPAAAGPVARVWDLDCILGCPLPADVWLDATFQDPALVPTRYHPRFRVVPSATFLTGFATDRSHMRTRHGWRKPPPPWSPPGPVAGVTMNLDLYRDADPSRGPGVVLDRPAFARHLDL